jgi:hypothetical protein
MSFGRQIRRPPRRQSSRISHEPVVHLKQSLPSSSIPGDVAIPDQAAHSWRRPHVDRQKSPRHDIVPETVLTAARGPVAAKLVRLTVEPGRYSLPHYHKRPTVLSSGNHGSQPRPPDPTSKHPLPPGACICGSSRNPRFGQPINASASTSFDGRHARPAR